MGNNQTIEWKDQKPVRLTDMLKQIGISFPMPCGGKGSCGKCRVRFLAGAPEANAADRQHFTGEELKQGWRLGCQTLVQGCGRVWLPQLEEEKMEVLSSFEETFHSAQKKGWGIGIDIGTTTIALVLADLSSGEILKKYACVNHQRSLGADVLTRIQKANEGRREELTDSIHKDLYQAVEKLLEDFEDDISTIDLAVAGNTVMLHLLLGYSCKTLGQAPFTPVHLRLLHDVRHSFYKTLGKSIEENVTIFPGISAFVGADIVSGIYMLDMTARHRPAMLLDLGTNGEMALWTGKEMYVTSTAAGPAFEGGSIKNGVPGIPGAICSVYERRGRIRIKTIADREPEGICGTGLISAICVLRKMGVIDDTGMLAEPYFEEGYPLWIQSQWRQIRLYQEDIREVQMAKAAIRAGMEILLEEAGVREKELESIYLAGGMGVTLDPEHAAAIGLIPQTAANRCEAVGNASLGGAVRYLISNQKKSGDEALERIAGKAQTVLLAQHPDFHERYIKYIDFPKNEG